MSLLKRHTHRRRHMGRRLAGVGLGVALIVLGLEAPAFAVPPGVSAFAPTSGPGGCVVQITGVNFTNPVVTDVDFNGVNAANFAIISDTEIWATTPAAVTSGFITVTNQTGSGSSSGTFNVATPGGCAPTADSFTPTCGPAAGPAGGITEDATKVAITGTNLMKSSTVGAEVGFGPWPGGLFANETTPPTAPTLTTRTVVVPQGAANGPIAVRTFNNVNGEGLNFSATQFSVGTCITSFSPASGDVGATVTITGVGFKNVTQVQFFNGVPALFTKTADTDAVDTITATVPFGAATGPIKLFTVEAPNGTTVSTATDFTVGGGVTGHARNVTLKLSGALRMKGKVKVPDGFTDCGAAVSVKLQKKKAGGGWKTLKTVTTDAAGAYSGKVANKPGKYRALAPKTTAGGETCLKDASPVRTN
jgi:IPT/TIG domain